jgi:TPR repeat protein
MHGTPGRPPDCDASMMPPATKASICGCRPWAEECTSLLEKAAGQGHAYAMHTMANIHRARKEHEQAVAWLTKGAEAGLPRARRSLGRYLEEGNGPAAPNCPAAAAWYKRAGEAGDAEAAGALSNMYAVGRGGPGR